MGYRPEDLVLDEGYWESLLKDVEVWSQDRLNPDSSAEARRRTNGYGSGVASAQLRNVWESERVGSAFGPHAPEIWVALREAMQHGDVLEVEVTASNRGGLIVRYHTLRGFVPASHLLDVTPELDEAARRAALARYIGQRIGVCVIEVDPSRDRIVFSERAAQEKKRREVPPLLNEIIPGEVRRGRVTNLTAFGAFVDLGGYEGLIHVSEMSWSRVGHPRDVLTIGQEIDVFVMSVDPEEGRVALSLKRTKPDPWMGIERRYTVGQMISGRVTNVVDFGVFVKVEDDLEGLIHVSELGEGSFLHPRNVVREGEYLTARVIGVDGEMRRLALSLRGVKP
ncbi:MAG: S1 RNA-binding domain-containing protein [Anaerolineae bacterium]|nr:S1 RNA-binding domain-containing protein [Thermoflexales bacterium]MDW8408932.1 S1 RNA-binding domain-containing protein [Anaerolineae bacterium]